MDFSAYYARDADWKPLAHRQAHVFLESFFDAGLEAWTEIQMIVVKLTIAAAALSLGQLERQPVLELTQSYVEP